MNIVLPTWNGVQKAGDLISIAGGVALTEYKHLYLSFYLVGDQPVQVYLEERMIYREYSRGRAYRSTSMRGNGKTFSRLPTSRMPVTRAWEDEDFSGVLDPSHASLTVCMDLSTAGVRRDIDSGLP